MVLLQCYWWNTGLTHARQVAHWAISSTLRDFVVVYFCKTVTLYHAGWPGTQHKDHQVGLKLRWILQPLPLKYGITGTPDPSSRMNLLSKKKKFILTEISFNHSQQCFRNSLSRFWLNGGQQSLKKHKSRLLNPPKKSNLAKFKRHEIYSPQ